MNYPTVWNGTIVKQFHAPEGNSIRGLVCAENYIDEKDVWWFGDVRDMVLRPTSIKEFESGIKSAVQLVRITFHCALDNSYYPFEVNELVLKLAVPETTEFNTF